MLAIEISSPSTRRHDLVDKRELYERWGVPFIFVDRKPSPWQIRVFGQLPGWAEGLFWPPSAGHVQAHRVWRGHDRGGRRQEG